MKKEHITVTLSGVLVDLLDPDIHSIPLEDIIHSLACIRRFGNQIRDNYTVADHCINSYRLAKALGFNKSIQQQAFTHDFSESICGDMPSPLKNIESVQGYKFIEGMWQKLFSMRFCNVSRLDEKVHCIDFNLLLWEASYLNKYIYNKIVSQNSQVSCDEVVDSCNHLLGAPKIMHYDYKCLEMMETYQELFGEIK